MTRLFDALRVLLGAVLVITAARYFMPFLLEPYVPLHPWSDPMAIRLMTAFDTSGLGAVARFIHLVAGAMLLTNRTVPFALAAIMPVNVCGLFISLFIEGAPLVATLALLTVALNALLMFAYLDSYRAVLTGGSLADGETAEAGGNYSSLYLNPLSGAPATAYLGAAAALAAALAFYGFVVPGLNSLTGLAVLAVPAVLLAVGWVRALARKG